MSVVTFDELIELCKSSKGRLLALDVGKKTVGVALSDETRMIASPYRTLDRKGTIKDIAAISDIIVREKAIAVVIGLPIHMDGSEGDMCLFVRQFGQHLVDSAQVPVCYWDERLSSVAVERLLLDADLSRKRRKEVIDKMAAGYILQGVLDRLRKVL